MGVMGVEGVGGLDGFGGNVLPFSGRDHWRLVDVSESLVERDDL